MPAAVNFPCSVSTSVCSRVAKSPFDLAGGRDDLDAALAGQHRGVDHVHRVGHVPFEQPGGERGGQQPRVSLGQVAAELERRLADRPLGHLGLEQAEPAGEIDELPHLVQLGPVDRGHVDGELHDAAGQEVDEQLRRLDGDGLLRLDRATPRGAA